MRAEERLQLFLYLLMRDELPFGAVMRLVKEVETLKGNTPVYSAKGLASDAGEMAKRLVNQHRIASGYITGYEIKDPFSSFHGHGYGLPQATVTVQVGHEQAKFGLPHGEVVLLHEHVKADPPAQVTLVLEP